LFRKDFHSPITTTTVIIFCPKSTVLISNLFAHVSPFGLQSNHQRLIRRTCRAKDSHLYETIKCMNREFVYPKWLCVIVSCLLLFVFAACGEREIPPEAQITCESDEDCPTGWICKEDSAGEKRCVRASGGDSNPPKIQGEAIIDPALGTAGTVFTICFSADEELESPPMVWVNTGQGRKAAELYGSESVPTICDGKDWAFSYAAGIGQDLQGTRALTAGLVDLALNQAEGVALGSFELDFTPPEVTSINLDQTHASIAASINLDFVVSEELKAAPVILMQQTGEEAAYEWDHEPTPMGPENSYSFTYSPTGMEAEGTYGFTLHMEDRAGNIEDRSLSEDLILILDFTAPILEDPVIAPDEVAGPGDLVEVTFAIPVGEAFSELPQLSIDAPPSDGGSLVPPSFGPAFIDEGNLYFSDTIRPVECAGADMAWDLSLTGGHDMAGNPMEGVGFEAALRVDCKPPALVTHCIYPAGDMGTACPDEETPRAYKLDDVVRVVLSTDEPAGDSLLRFSGGAPLPSCDGEESDNCCAWDAQLNELTCQKTVGPDDTNGVQQVTVELSDARDNFSSATLGEVTFDTQAPFLVSTTLTPNPANASSEVVLSLSFSELVTNVDLDMKGLPFLGNNEAAGNSYLYVLAGGSVTTSSSYDLSVTATDLAGNMLMNGDLEPLVFDTDFPTVEIINIQTDAGLTPPRVKVGDTLSFNIDTDGEVLESFDVSMGSQQLDLDQGCSQPTDAGVADYRCSLNVLALDGVLNHEASASLLVKGTDGAGNLTTASQTIVMDFAAPSVPPATVAISYIPEAGNPLATTIAAKAYSSVRVSLVTSEPVRGVPDLVMLCHTNGMFGYEEEEEEEEEEGTYFVYSKEIVATTQPGDCNMEVTLEDLVGNVDTVTLDKPFVVDLVPPVAQDVINGSAIKHLRVPWGAEQTGGTAGNFLVNGGFTAEQNPINCQAPSCDISVLENGLAETIAQLRVYGPTGQLIGALTPRDDGKLLPQQLAGADVASISLRAIDAAGNESADEVLVRTVEWVATMGNKVAGQVLENPHRFESRAVFTHTPTQPGAVELGDAEGVAAVGGLAPSAHGAAHWVPLQPANPTGRHDTMAAWNSHRGEALLFGGRPDARFEDLYADTWRFDGTGWASELSIDATGDGDPQARHDHAMAFDAVRGRIVLFGGEVDRTLGLLAGDTWEWHGTEWVEMTPKDPEADGPSPRRGHVLVYDAARGVTVMHGGQDEIGVSNETWTWDGVSWTLCGPAFAVCPTTDEEGDGVPSARKFHAAAYDAQLDEVLLHGGENEEGILVNDTWSWNGERWLRLHDGSGTAPIPRRHARLTYDVAQGEGLLFGGSLIANSDTEYLGDLWRWKDSAWSQVSVSDPEGDGNPALAHGHGLVYDSGQDRVLLFGGNHGEHLFSSERTTWEWDGNSFTKLRETSVYADYNVATPDARSVGAMAFDTQENRFLLFGGLLTTQYVANDTWGWDGQQWTQLGDGDPAPGQRGRHAMAYDTLDEELVLFGGATEELLFCADNETWVFQEGTWEKKSPTSSPGPREHHAMTYDTARDRVVLYGGQDLCNPAQPTGTWEWNGTTWQEITTSDSPGQQVKPKLVFDEIRQVSVLFDHETGEVWEWDGNNWRQPPVADPESDGNPGPIASSTLAYDPDARAVVLITGVLANGSITDLAWAWNGRSWRLLDIADPLGNGGLTPRREAVSGFDPIRNELMITSGLSAGEIIDDSWMLKRGDATFPGQAFIPSFIAAGGPEPVQCLRNPANCPIDKVSIRAHGGARRSVPITLRLLDQNPSGQITDIQTTYPTETASVDDLGQLIGSLGDTVWSIRISDQYTLDDGTLNTWCVILNGGAEQCSSPATPLRYLAEVEDHIWVSNVGTLTDVAVRLDITHDYANDLQIDLVVSEPELGATLALFKDGRFQNLASNSAPPTAPERLDYETTDPDTIGRIFLGPEKAMAVGIIPSGENGVRLPMGEVATDYAEVRVLYHHPEEESADGGTGDPDAGL
jgi:subtilisin-like proprotein convertase family protein